VEYNERADQLESDADKMEKESKRVGGRIEESRSDWESKEADQKVPGAQAALPGEEDEEESGDGEDASSGDDSSDDDTSDDDTETDEESE
jgi:hypothetical protein